MILITCVKCGRNHKNQNDLKACSHREVKKTDKPKAIGLYTCIKCGLNFPNMQAKKTHSKKCAGKVARALDHTKQKHVEAPASDVDNRLKGFQVADDKTSQVDDIPKIQGDDIRGEKLVKDSPLFKEAPKTTTKTTLTAFRALCKEKGVKGVGRKDRETLQAELDKIEG